MAASRTATTQRESLRKSLKPPPARGQTGHIYEAVRDQICSLRFPPGTLLVESALAQQFDVSRTPVRQVLQRLEYEGLVETKNGIGTIVSGVGFRDYRDIYAFRLKLSEMIGDFSSSSDAPTALKRVEELVPQVEALKIRDFDEFWRILHELHFAINGLITNRELRQVHDRCYFQASRVWYSFVDVLWDEEVEFLKRELEETARALRSGDMRAVGFVQRNFISFGLARIAAQVTDS